MASNCKAVTGTAVMARSANEKKKNDCGDESADAAVTMLFAAVRGRCWGARDCGDESRLR